MDNNNPKKEYVYKGVTAFLVVAASVLFYFIMLRLGSIFTVIGKIINVLQPIIFGLVIAYLVNPMIVFFDSKLLPFFNKKVKNKEKANKLTCAISTTLSLIVFCVIITGIIWLIIPQFIESIMNIVTVLPGQIDNYSEKLAKFVHKNKQLESVLLKALDYEKNWLQTELAPTVSKYAATLASGVWSAFTFIKNFVLGLIIAIYLLLSKKKFVNQTKKLFYAIFKEKTVNRIFAWIKTSHGVFSGFISGKIVDSIIIGILCFIGTAIMKIPYSVLVSVVICVTNVIPVFGPWIGGIPMSILVALNDPIKGLYFGIFVIFLQTLDGNFIGPKILGDKIGLDTFWVMFAIILGGGMFGVLGMLIGVPGFAVIYYILVAIINHSLNKKNKSTESDAYASGNGDLTITDDGGQSDAQA